MGNLQAESGGTFDPRIVEFGWKNSQGVTSQAGKPETWDDFVPPDQNAKGQPGYGIVQWTSPGRKQGLRDKAAGGKAGFIPLQLDYLWEELNSPSYKATVLDVILASSSLEEVSNVFLEKFEIPADIPGNRPIRIGYAEKILADMTGGAAPTPSPSPTGSSSSSSSSDCSAGGSSTTPGNLGKVVEIAQREFDTFERDYLTNTDGYISKFSGHPGGWCADFVSYVLREAGVPFTGGGDGGWHIPTVQGVQAYFESKNSFHPARTGYTPKPGDVVVFDEGIGYWPQHVNIVVAVDGKSITTIGGNESNKVRKQIHNDYDATNITGYGTPVAP
jgi:hypothetical protein